MGESVKSLWSTILSSFSLADVIQIYGNGLPRDLLQ
jgi:hypothetical protein